MSDERILVILPTRGRPWSALEAIASVMKHAAKPATVEIIVCNDYDDPKQFDLIYSDKESPISQLLLPRKSFVEWLNFCVDDLENFDWVTWLGDDVRYLTPGWDDIVRSHQEFIIYGPDGIQDERIPTHPFIRCEIPRALEWLVPPKLKHYCADLFIQALGNELHSIAYDPALRIEHLHVNNGKRAKDQTHVEAMQHWGRDHENWEEGIKQSIPAIAQLVTNALR